MPAQTPIKCFRYLPGIFFVQDFANHVMPYLTVFDESTMEVVKKLLADHHKRPVLAWDEEYTDA